MNTPPSTPPSPDLMSFQDFEYLRLEHSEEPTGTASANSTACSSPNEDQQSLDQWTRQRAAELTARLQELVSKNLLPPPTSSSNNKS